MNLSWIWKSIIAMLLIVPLVLLAGFFRSNYGVKSEGVLFAWVAGVAVGIICLSEFGVAGLNAKNLYQPFWPLVCIFFIGMISGTFANVFLIMAMFDPAVPNPAIPYAIFGINPAVAYLLTLGAALIFPQFFKGIEFRITDLLGVVLMVAGMTVLIYRR